VRILFGGGGEVGRFGSVERAEGGGLAEIQFPGRKGKRGFAGFQFALHAAALQKYITSTYSPSVYNHYQGRFTKTNIMV
jgi:hypothetical protein